MAGVQEAHRCIAERSSGCWRSAARPGQHPSGFIETAPARCARNPSRSRTDTPTLTVVSSYAPAATPGMPGPYPGRVVSVKSDKSVDASTGAANDAVVREMMARGMRALTGAATTPDAWRRFFVPSDVVGIKVNCGGYPHCVSAYEIVAEVVRQLMGIGVPVSQIYVYERFQNQLDEVNYAPHLPEGVQIVAAERANRNIDNSGYDPATYLEADLFGEDDTRSNMMRLVSQRLTKIINIPNMKDHGATGVTGCLKNIAYGSFSNVARTHQRGKSHTYSVVGTLAAHRAAALAERCCRSWTACAACGTAVRSRERRATCSIRARSCSAPIRSPSIGCCSTSSTTSAAREGAISIWDRSPASLKVDDARARDADPNVNIIIREPGHVEYASTLGLGVYDRAKIKVQDVTV